MVAGPNVRPAPPPSAAAKRHPGIPDRGYIICHFCLNWATREENDISKHYGDEEAHALTQPQWAKDGPVPYDLCRVVPSRVAAALVIDAKGDPAKLLKAATHFEVVQHKTKAKPATHEEMAKMFRLRCLPVPAWLWGIRLVRVPGWEEDGAANDEQGEGEGEDEDENEDENQWDSPGDETLE